MLRLDPETITTELEGGIQMSRSSYQRAGRSLPEPAWPLSPARSDLRPARSPQARRASSSGCRRRSATGTPRCRSAQGFLRHGRLGVPADRQSDLLGREPCRAGQQRHCRQGGHHPHAARKPRTASGVRARPRRGRHDGHHQPGSSRKRRRSSGSASSARASSTPASSTAIRPASSSRRCSARRAA